MSTLRRNSAAPCPVSPPRARPHSPQRHPPAKHLMCGGTGSPRTPTPLGADRRRVLPGVPDPRVYPPDRFVEAELMLEINFRCFWCTHQRVVLSAYGNVGGGLGGGGGMRAGKKSLCTKNGPLILGPLFKVSFFFRGTGVCPVWHPHCASPSPPQAKLRLPLVWVLKSVHAPTAKDPRLEHVDVTKKNIVEYRRRILGAPARKYFQLCPPPKK